MAAKKKRIPPNSTVSVTAGKHKGEIATLVRYIPLSQSLSPRAVLANGAGEFEVSCRSFRLPKYGITDVNPMYWD